MNPTRGGENSENKTGVLAGLTNPGGGVHRHIRVDKVFSPVESALFILKSAALTGVTPCGPGWRRARAGNQE